MDSPVPLVPAMPVASAPAHGSAVFEAGTITMVHLMGEATIRASRGVDLDFFQRGCVVQFGPSGNGKATLLNLLMGLDVQPRRIRRRIPIVEHHWR